MRQSRGEQPNRAEGRDNWAEGRKQSSEELRRREHRETEWVGRIDKTEER
jgi:hypothetical protein